jgi:arginase
VERLGARDHGDVLPPPYVDFQRPGQRPRNEPGVAAYSRALAEQVAAASQGDAFVLLLGGDCSVVLGSLLGLRPRGGPPIGLAYVDGHADFATPEESLTGSAASMCLALAVGRGDTPLARLSADGPLVRAEDTVLIGRRDHAEPWYGHDALRAAPLLDLPDDAVRERGLDGTARATLERLDTLEGASGSTWMPMSSTRSTCRRWTRRSRAGSVSPSSAISCARSSTIRGRAEWSSPSTTPSWTLSASERVA